jgi:hypothetical protein
MTGAAKKKAPKAPISIIEACESPQIFGPWFRDRKTWAAWFAFLKVMFGLPLDDAELAVFQTFTGRTTPLAAGYLEATLIIGRRGGKSLVLALCAAFLAAFYDWSPYLTGGERGTIMIVASDMKQGRAIFRYLKEMLSIPLLAGLIERETQNSIDLKNGITVEILAANFKTVRSYTLVACLADELAFWPTDEGLANPDSEIIGAIRPAMATVPKAMLLKASSPYARRGELWEDYKRYFGKNDADVLVWQAQTKGMNPTVSDDFLAKEYAKDPAKAQAEYGAEFRTDIESFVSPEAVNACVIAGRYELPPIGGVIYSAFLDAAGGSGSDSMALCLTHREEDRVVVDLVREVKPQFSPETVVLDFVQLLKSYRVLDNVTADRFAGLWVAERFRVHGIQVLQAAKPKSDLYRDFLPIINSGGVELLDHAKAIGQICGLERRTARGGRDSIDHAPGGHDDLANVIAGAVVGTAIQLNHAENWIEYYRRLNEEPNRFTCDLDDIRASGPAFGFSFSSGPLVKLVLPPGPIAAAGSLYTNRAGLIIARRIGDQTIAEVSREDAVDLLKGNVAWRNANEDLSRELLGETSNEN